MCFSLQIVEMEKSINGESMKEWSLQKKKKSEKMLLPDHQTGKS